MPAPIDKYLPPVQPRNDAPSSMIVEPEKKSFESDKSVESAAPSTNRKSRLPAISVVTNLSTPQAPPTVVPNAVVAHQQQQQSLGLFPANSSRFPQLPPHLQAQLPQIQRHLKQQQANQLSAVSLQQSPPPPPPPPAVRSLFPQYNPELPHDHQPYFPAVPVTSSGSQQSPPVRNFSHQSRPQSQMTTASHSQPPSQPPSTTQQTRAQSETDEANPTSAFTHIESASDVASVTTATTKRASIYRRVDNPVNPTTSSADDVRGLWRVANGWKAPATEGEIYCLRVSQEKDTPTFLLGSASQPFYRMQIDPTSAAAYISLKRLDPARQYKPNDQKHWHEVLSTVLEEEARRHRPNDGLVALLYPIAASRRAIDRPDDEYGVLMAERECARLVWDDDTSMYYLVHPALASPFKVTVEKSIAWSRTEYTLEHHESPFPLAKLTRDGTGKGWLEIDTGIAAKIDCFFMVDVVVTALMLVAFGDQTNRTTEIFDPPPINPPAAAKTRHSRRLPFGSPTPPSPSAPSTPQFDQPPYQDRSASVSSKRPRRWMWSRASTLRNSNGSDSRPGTPKEEYDLDLESQSVNFAAPPKTKGRKKSKEESEFDQMVRRFPWPLRLPIKLIKAFFMAIVWLATCVMKMIALVLRGVARCFGYK